jgi:uncharacterized RDD family membrane protein YckC
VAKLVVNPTSTNRREIVLGRTLLSIGRDPSNDLVLPDAMVSRRHAVIEYRGSQYFLRDCNSSNGSVVNGDRVSEKSLRDGDIVAIGSARLLFREELDAEGAAKVVPHPSAPRLSCPACEAQYRKGDIYCRACGAKLPEPSGPPKAVCVACGTAVLLPAHFCNACGAKLPEPAASPAPAPPEPAPPAPGEPAPAAPAAPSPEALKTEEMPVGAPAVPPSSPGSASSTPRAEGALARATNEPEPSPARPTVERAQAPPSASPAVARVAPRPEPSPRTSPAVQASRPGPPGPRALAALVDLGLVGLAEAAMLVPLAFYWSSWEIPRAPAEVPYLPVLLSVLALCLALLLGASYYVWSWGVRGATPGQRLLDLAVEGDDGRFPIGLGRAAIRLFGYFLSILSLGIGFLLVPLTGSGLHDRIAGTRVVARRRGAL